jgi:hypothetical protein
VLAVRSYFSFTAVGVCAHKTVTSLWRAKRIEAREALESGSCACVTSRLFRALKIEKYREMLQ